LTILYVTSNELFIYYQIDKLVALEVPIHKRRKRVMNFYVFIILSAHKL